MLDQLTRNVKDYGVWLILKIFLEISVFSFNTLKRQNRVENGILKSRKEAPPEDKVKGSLYQMVEKRTMERISSGGDWTFLRDGLSGKELKASEALSLAKRLSVALQSKGFAKGSKIHIVTNNNIHYHPLLLAAWRLGGVPSCGDSALNADTIQYQIEEIKAKFVVCDSETEQEVKRALRGVSSEVHLLSFGRVEDCEADLAALAAGADENKAAQPAEVEGGNSWEECAVILWSSGTTGRPKGILHSQQSMWSHIGGTKLPPINWLITLHFFHINGMFFPLHCLTAGSTLTFVLGRGFSLEVVLKNVRDHRPTSMIVGSHHYVQLSEIDLSATKISSGDLKSVKALTPSGAAVPSICRGKLRKIFPLLVFQINGYGQTEVSGMSGGAMEYEGLGEIFPGAELKVVNPDTREICKPYEHGEICARTHRSMMGYLNKPRSAYYDDDGFGMTGDIGYYSESGVVYYVDRVKEIIKYCNNHVAPTQLEDILQTHPAVTESLVFGIKEPSVQELISAVIVLKNDATNVSEGDIVRYVNSRVDADYKKIRGRVLFREVLPRNTSGKLLRREMRRWAEEEAEKEK